MFGSAGTPITESLSYQQTAVTTIHFTNLMSYIVAPFSESMDKASGYYTIDWTREPWIKIEET